MIAAAVATPIPSHARTSNCNLFEIVNYQGKSVNPLHLDSKCLVFSPFVNRYGLRNLRLFYCHARFFFSLLLSFLCFFFYYSSRWLQTDTSKLIRGIFFFLANMGVKIVCWNMYYSGVLYFYIKMHSGVCVTNEKSVQQFDSIFIVITPNNGI